MMTSACLTRATNQTNSKQNPYLEVSNSTIQSKKTIQMKTLHTNYCRLIILWTIQTMNWSATTFHRHSNSIKWPIQLHQLLTLN